MQIKLFLKQISAQKIGTKVILVSNLQGGAVHLTSDRGGKLKLDRFRSQMRRSFSYQILGQGRRGCIAERCMAKYMGLAIPQNKPHTYTSNPREVGIPTHLLS
jgi:hypothetical protein